MTKAKITNPEGFKCAPEGHTVITIPFNTIVEGKVADWALDARCASRIINKKRKVSTKDAGAAPENK
jgi:hypothetical protein